MTTDTDDIKEQRTANKGLNESGGAVLRITLSEQIKTTDNE